MWPKHARKVALLVLPDLKKLAAFFKLSCLFTKTRQAEQHLKKMRASSNIGFILITRDKINRKTHNVMASSGAESVPD